MLAVDDLRVVYNDVISVLRGVTLTVPQGEIVALLGANGAGKTTTLRAISGLLDHHGGKISGGDVLFRGESVQRRNPAAIVRSGMAQVMEGRRIFSELTVDENLRAGGFTRRGSAVTETHTRIMDLFPVLSERRKSVAGYLSGGEQQMLAMGRGLMADPELLLLDEPSLGLAPLIVQQIRDLVVEINRSGTSVLLVEQNATMALSIAHHGYILENGGIVRDGPGPELLEDESIREFYLGVGDTGRRSFRDVKSYRRRKQWSA
ncbi:MAG: ABC transporter ATP-binding protein [Acidimicrobiia bacterium]